MNSRRLVERSKTSFFIEELSDGTYRAKQTGLGSAEASNPARAVAKLADEIAREHYE
jgi:hypothetical protein